MGSCSSLSKNIFCCSRGNLQDQKFQKIDINLKKQKEIVYESDNQDNKKISNIEDQLKTGKLKLRTKTFKDNLNSNLLDDSDHIVHLRAKKSSKKFKNKRKNIGSNKTFWKRGHTCRIKKNQSIKILKKRTKKNLKNSVKKSSKDNSFEINKNEPEEKEINLSFRKNSKIDVVNDNKIVEDNSDKNINCSIEKKEIINNKIINNNIINNNIINNINININENKGINNGINIKLDLNHKNIEYKKGKTNINRLNKNVLRKETEDNGNSVYIKIVSEKSIDYSHHNIGRPTKSIIYHQTISKLRPQDLKSNTMESNIKVTIDHLNHARTVNYNNKLKKGNTSSINSCDAYTVKETRKSKNNITEKNSLKNRVLTGTDNNSSECIESESSDTKIKLYEKLEKEEEIFIKNVLKTNKLFITELDEDAIEQFAMGFYCVEFQKGQILYNEGNEAKIFYIIYSGKVLIYTNEENNYEKSKKNLNKINNFTLKEKDENPFSTLHPKTIEAKDDNNNNNENISNIIYNNNNDNISNNISIYNHSVNNIYNRHKKAETFSGKISVNSQKTSIELIKGYCFGQESLKENGTRLQNAKTLEKSKIFCCSGEFYLNAKNYMQLKIAKEQMLLLRKLPLFKYCEENKLLSLTKKLKESKYNYCSIIINENEMNNTIYVIKEGEVRITKKFKKISSLQKDSYFGHINLITKKPSMYTYSIESKKAILFEIPYSLVLEFNVNDLLYKIFIHAIKTSIRIKQLFIHNYKYFYNIFKLKYYQDGDVVYKKSLEENKKLCVIISGGIKKEKENNFEAKEEQVFGDNIIDSRQDLNHEIVSFGESLIFEASWKNIVSASEVDKQNNFDIFETVRNLKRVKILNNIHEIKILELAKAVNREIYKDNTLISKEGEISNKFYIIKKGKVKLYQKGKFVRDLDAGGFFGEIPGITGVLKLFTAFSVGETECYVINKRDFNLLEPSILESIKDYGYLDDLNIELKDLYIVKSLGKGKFGKVYLVHNQKHFYAIKAALLSEVLQLEKIKYYLKEKEIMKMLDFPFVLRFVKTLKTSQHIFFLEEHIEGISLRTYLSKRKKENNKNIHETEFYGAILLLVLNYLHKKRIIHRDIKPDNCMIDQKGYLKIIDFGISKYLKDEDLTYTVCGTPHYMAPEIISGKGYSYSADYWSFGITLFEIFYDYLPFGHGARDILDIYQQILGKKLILPYDPKFNQFNSFLKLILAKNIMHRVCNYKLLKSHPFFQDFQFEQLLNHSIKPVFIPEIENDIKNLTVCNIPVMDYCQKDIKNSTIDIGKNDDYNKIQQLLEDF